MIELLAPAGDRAALEAAVRGGADAVYLGLTSLNARRGAANFTPDALEEACAYCHERGVKVHVTVNTLVKEGELGELEKVARALYDGGADAAIVQDLGAAWALGQMLPQLPLHASTQMAIHNRQGVRFLKARGFARAVLARELCYDEIAQCAGEGLEIEVFAHGALCVACSGQCLFSSLVGGRSGNRGLCAQPCRLPYRLEGPLCRAKGDLLSPKDLCTLDDLNKLKSTGAASLKLEGRLKGPEYVYKVTSLYRLALDGEKVDASLLRQVFNRGYSRGYGAGVDDRELMSVAGEKHVLPGGGAWPEPAERKVDLTGTLTAHIGQPLSLSLTDGQARSFVQGPMVERAQKSAGPDRLVAQIEKTGGTPYRLRHLTLEADTQAFASAAALNGLRRQALTQLGAQRAQARRILNRAPKPLEIPRGSAPPQGVPLLSVQAQQPSLLQAARGWGADEVIWAPADVTAQGLAGAPVFPFALALPPTLTGDCLKALNQWALGQSERITATLLSNPAHLALSWPGELRCDGAMNVTNPLTIASLGLPYMPSPELTCAEIRALPGEKELLVYGRLTLMLLRHCPLNHCLGGGPHAACRRCDRDEAGLDGHVLIDRKGARFPLSRMRTGQGCLVRVNNSVPMMLLKRLGQLPPAARWRLVLTDEDLSLSRAVVVCHRRALDNLPLAGQEWDRLLSLPATTGHYFRGVE